MSFMEKIKSRPRDSRGFNGAPESQFDDIGLSYDDVDNPDTVGGRPTQAPPAPTLSPPVADSSIISEVTPSELSGDFSETRLHGATGDETAGAGGLPLIGRWSTRKQQRLLIGMLAVGVVLMAVTTMLALRSANRGAEQVGAVGVALTESQRLTKSVAQAVIGSSSAFDDVKKSAKTLSSTVHALAGGNDSPSSVSATVRTAVDPLLPMVAVVETNAAMVVEQRQALLGASNALRAIDQNAAPLLDTVQRATAQRLQAGASSAELAAMQQLAVLSQRIGLAANGFRSMEAVSRPSVALFAKDVGAFQTLADGLSGPAREAVAAQFAATRTRAAAIIDHASGLMAARDAQLALQAENEPLAAGLEKLQKQLAMSGGMSRVHTLVLALSGLLALAGAAGLLRLYVGDQTARARLAEAQRLEAERQEQEAKRVNDANQAAILRLMNELQTVAEGDLTQQATVTEDITGAIADSVNYTVEELRTLVSAVQSTVARVTDTTQQVEQTSTELLATSTEQLREIRDTGESVLQMAGRINEVSAQAQRTAQVARQSLEAAESGLTAVNNTIGGMNSIREQIQDTSKRIKRLGESSQEIGEITELISDITEQTNVLALNAAIQAASAGEAGRGFSVVAEEVQRLAERSGDATKQIAALVRTIQTDTQEAVAAMERSTHGVVEGAKLSDAAGAALGDIDRVTRELSQLIAQISSQALQEADSANVVASNIQHIFAVTEQTGEGTRSTAQMVRELSRSAEELKQSVSRFKVA